MGDYNVISTEWPEGTRLVLLWRFAGCAMNVILRQVMIVWRCAAMRCFKARGYIALSREFIRRSGR